MSETAKTSKKKEVKKPAPKASGKSQGAKKATSKATAAKAKRKAPSGLRAALNGRAGVMLIGASLIFCVLMAVATVPTVVLLARNFSGGGGNDDDGPTLIAAPLVEAAVSTPKPSSPPPTEEEAPTEEETATQTASLSFDPDMQPTPDGAYREGRVPILMYHYISTPPDDADAYRLDLSVTPENFEEQMAWLADNGYTTISPYQLIDWLANGTELPDKPVMLTFDDGYVDNYQNAFPILQKYGHTGTFFILTGVTEEGNPEYMSWDMLREMVAAGMNVEMHAAIHISLAGTDPATMQIQVADSADIMEERLGYRPRFLAYPGGDYDDAAIQALKDNGYWLGLTTIYGCLQYTGNEYEVPRIRVRGEYNLGQFAYFLESAFEDEEFCYGYG